MQGSGDFGEYGSRGMGIMGRRPGVWNLNVVAFG